MTYSEDMATLDAADIGFSEAEPRDYFALLKPRVMSLVVFTAFAGMIVAPGDIHPFLAFVAILCIAIGAGASGALNMWYDADIDRVMSRTSGRPIPTGRIKPQEALSFGMVLAAFSVLTLGLLVNWFAGFLLAFTIFFYAVIYTMWLKRSTPQNIVIGGAAGAFPPMIGWACVTGSVSIESTVLFLMIFLWTPPHFWALALYKVGDYEKAGVPMMPNVAGMKSTKGQILFYAVLTACVGVLPYVLGFASPVYGVFSAVMGLLFVQRAWRVFRMPNTDAVMAPAKSLFGFSLLYLASLFAVLLIEGLAARFGL